LRIAIILNGISGKKKKFYSSILPPLQSKFDITVFETNHAGHAQALATDVGSQYSIVLAAGGDGTLNEVLNGLFELDPQPVLGLIPLGSGNDFANACGILPTADCLKKLLLDNLPKPTDVGKITCVNKEGYPIKRYFINVCSLGMGPTTVMHMKEKPGWLGTNLRYMVSILQTFLTHQPEEVKIASENFEWSGKARVVAIANGKSFGNKIYVAPEAKPDDGLFDLFIGGNVPLSRFLLHLQSLKSRRKIVSDDIVYSSGANFDITSSKRVMIEAEGELVGYLPMNVEMKSRKVIFLR
jgi:diacylglycerol kinase (ATP)